MATEQKTSDEFWRAFIYGGSLITECEGCGTTYFADEGDYEEGEKEELFSKAKSEPERYVYEPYSSVGVLLLNGKRYVDGCAKCDEGISKIENFIWEHRDGIRRYLKARSNLMLDEAQREVKLNEDLEATQWHNQNS